MTLYENIALPLRETTNLEKGEIDLRVTARIELSELSDAANKYPSELSGGMQKRVALARALVTDPQIVLFDEPTSGQDPVRKNAILSMIAQYQRKFGFTAILVTHEIPNVYFISNRILALYDRAIVFQGTPEELEHFNHPFKDEVIRSQEGLQEELTGLYTKHQFKVLYHAQLKQKTIGETYSVVVFTLEELDAIISSLGHEAAQEAIRNMGAYVDKHFGAIGGFSTRRHTNEFVTLLPYSDLTEFESMLKDFVYDFQEHGIRDIWAGARKQVASEVCVEFAIFAGIAQGQPIVEIDSVIDSAKHQQEEIARFRCDVRRQANEKVRHGNNSRHLSRFHAALYWVYDGETRPCFLAWRQHLLSLCAIHQRERPESRQSC